MEVRDEYISIGIILLFNVNFGIMSIYQGISLEHNRISSSHCFQGWQSFAEVNVVSLKFL